MNIEEIRLAYNVSQATAYRYREKGIPPSKLKKFARKDSFSDLKENEKMRILRKNSENFENFENEKNEKNENEKNENFEKILNAIVRIEERLNCIEAQQNLIVASFEKNEKMRIQNENFESNIEKKEGGLGGVSLSFLESNSLIDIEDSIEDSIKENKKRKIEKIKKVRKVAIKSESEKQEIEQTFQIFKNDYPENTHELEEEKCRKHWEKLSNEEMQKALDSIPLIQERFKNTEPQYVIKLSNYILKKLWNDLDPKKIELINKNNKGDAYIREQRLERMKARFEQAVERVERRAVGTG